MTPLALIVEGKGEVDALPVLVRRLASSLEPPRYPRVLRPHRLPRGRLVAADDELGRALNLASIQGATSVLVVFDADDDPACQLGPRVAQRCRELRPDMRVGVVLAEREFEAWFIAATHSLQQAGLLGTATKPEVAPRDAKGWLHRNAPGGYGPTTHQATFAARIDLGEAASAPSFDKLRRELERLIRPDPP